MKKWQTWLILLLLISVFFYYLNIIIVWIYYITYNTVNKQTNKIYGHDYEPILFYSIKIHIRLGSKLITTTALWLIAVLEVVVVLVVLEQLEFT